MAAVSGSDKNATDFGPQLTTLPKLAADGLGEAKLLFGKPNGLSTSSTWLRLSSSGPAGFRRVSANNTRKEGP